MADLIHEQMAPLAWDSDGMPFMWPSGTVALKIRKYTGQRGRPPTYWDEHGPAHLSPDATMRDLRVKVKNESGDYRLFPVSKTGEELSPVACIKLVPLPDPEEVAPLSVLDDGPDSAMRPAGASAPAGASIPGVEPYRSTAHANGDRAQQGGIDMMYMFGRFMDQQEKRDAQLTQMMQALVASTAEVQRSTAEMIKVNNSTVQVASGLDALARLPAPPEIDEEQLAEKLAELMELEEPDTDDEQDKPGIIDRLGSLMNGPMGQMAAGLVGRYAQGMQQANSAQVKAAVAAAQAEEARANAIRAQAEAMEAKAKRAKAEAEADYYYEDDEEFEEETAQAEAAQASTDPQTASDAPSASPVTSQPPAQGAVEAPQADAPASVANDGIWPHHRGPQIMRAPSPEHPRGSVGPSLGSPPKRQTAIDQHSTDGPPTRSDE